MSIPRFIKTQANNFTPLLRTPWAGTNIAKIKKKYLQINNIPEKIGESWEVSSDPQFLSKVFIANINQWISIEAFLKSAGKEFLGAEVFSIFGAHCPILLKWLDSVEPLSVQIHPHATNKCLTNFETGKPEAWFIVNNSAQNNIYLGLNNLSLSELQSPDLKITEKQLYKFSPTQYSFISIPPGCVHALGANTFVIEPQLIWPQKTGKTWRLFDWNRKYDTQGKVSALGNARELHIEQGLSAINFNLPQGKLIESSLVQKLSSAQPFLNSHNTFAALIFTKTMQGLISPLIPNTFSVATCISGKARFVDTKTNEALELMGGESAIISAEVNLAELTFSNTGKDNPLLALFSLNLEALPWRF